ncbi:bifunctional biotin--[acetyl-CoA-carboxylase] ligase/biotin operon repressor BirA [Thiohalomonas denitrificans]|uniref:Bifunctional ligase/repressor BirA n=1 Tax=Thiohalomonas denitrificans TaxID=415747 RepID=A0A1G5R2V3_9GAMM|nr:bifunctional biotin--[acetyl-CoA-carboxylase] ligase/biotin operon repressor BirA [Thiohalomonas denitrificans]SCZ68435.1 BirA family transcriptional regulator, biotin operon repressor / biotin-[acetyl-CoA-carboxylase] ligase [Thiohalomonas denitrificans]
MNGEPGEIIERLVRLLADGRFHSGEELGHLMGISRAAVWKRLQQLEPLGLSVHSVRGRGHRLAKPLDLLNRQRILAGMDARVLDRCVGLDLKFAVDSTSAHLGRVAGEHPSGHICLTEYQTAGRGRRGRRWISPFGSNLYFSLLWRFQGAGQLGGLSLAVAVAVIEALESVGAARLVLKWPNDVLYEDRKLAGILIEVAGEATGECQVIVGIGVNIGMPLLDGNRIDQPWADLTETGARLDRNGTASALIGSLVQSLERFERYGLPCFLNAWRARDALYGQPVTVQFTDSELVGIGRGIDEAGQFLVEHEEGTERLSYGEVSIRRWAS